MKSIIAIVFAIVVASAVAQPNIVGTWSSEVCESFPVNKLPLSAHRVFEATADSYTLTLTFSFGSCTGGGLAYIKASGPYVLGGVSSSAVGCSVGDVGQVYNLDLYTNQTKQFWFTDQAPYASLINSTIATTCNWTDSGPQPGIPYDIRGLNCAALSIAACEIQYQIVQLVNGPTRLYFGPASADTTVADPCAESARPESVIALAFIKDLATPNSNSTACFATPTAASAPIAQPVASIPIAVPETKNVNPVSEANGQTRFIAILGLLAALVLGMF